MATFNKENFSRILIRICKTYQSQHDFENKSNVDRTYLSRYMNLKYTKPPSPKILQKLASASKGITTYEELMQVCGYIEIERTPIEDGAVKALEDMVARQVPGYSLIDITLRYIKRIEGKNVNN